MRIGLLMIADETDVLERTLAANTELVDCFYVLDGSDPSSQSEAICISHPKHAGYATDAELPRPRFPNRPTDGYRQFLYEWAAADHGYDNWFLLLHGDEVWTGLPDLDDGYDGFCFPLPFYFPRQGEPWDPDLHPLDQLRWHLRPGYPEFRMFKGSPAVRYLESQHFNVTPTGLGRVGWCEKPIRHYLYRSPEVQRARALRHQQTGFDPDNYSHITDLDAVYWTDAMIDRYRLQGCFAELGC